MRFIGFKTGEREVITEVNTVLILVATLALMAVISLAVILLVRRRIGHRVVEAEDQKQDMNCPMGSIQQGCSSIIPVQV